MEGLKSKYESNGDKELFDNEFKAASKIYRDYRIAVIRDPKSKKYSPDEILGDIGEKYRAQWYELFRDQDLMEEI